LLRTQCRSRPSPKTKGNLISRLARRGPLYLVRPGKRSIRRAERGGAISGRIGRKEFRAGERDAVICETVMAAAFRIAPATDSRARWRACRSDQRRA
jgi:hypothetical protein